MLEEQVNAIILDARENRIRIAEEAKAAGSNAGEEDSPLVNRLLNPEKILARLRVDHTGFSTLNNQRFGAKFVEEIANPDNILLFKRDKQTKTLESKATRKAREALKKPMDPEELERTNVEDLVNSILELPGSKLTLLSEKTLGQALEEYVDKNNLQSIPTASEEQLKKRQKMLISNPDFTGSAGDPKSAFPTESKLPEDAPSSSNGRKTKSKSSTKTSRSKPTQSFSSDEEGGNEEENVENSRTSSRKSTASLSTTKSSKSASRSTSTAGRRKQKLPDSDDDDDEVMPVDPPPTKSRSRRTTKKVNYSMDDDENDNNDSDAVVDMMNDDDDDDDDDEMVVESSTKSRSTRKTTRASPRRKTAAASSRRPTRKKRLADSDDDDDNDDGRRTASIGLDADWGSAATRSQL